jgi:hypothetical protein
MNAGEPGFVVVLRTSVDLMDDAVRRHGASRVRRRVVYAHSEGKLDRLTARGAASEPTITVRADLDLRQASGLIARYGTTHVVVTAPHDGGPLGIVSRLDIAQAVSAT